MLALHNIDEVCGWGLELASTELVAVVLKQLFFLGVSQQALTLFDNVGDFGGVREHVASGQTEVLDVVGRL